MSEPIYRLPPFRVTRLLTAQQLGQTLPWAWTRLKIPDLWSTTRGDGITVAILDSGADLNHPDLREKIVEAKDFTGSTFGPRDTNGHGSHCAGEVGAADNTIGIPGVGPLIKLVIGKVLGGDGSGRGDWIAAAIRWCIQRGGIDIISMSLGSSQPDPRINTACDAAEIAGIVVICAAGNEASGTGWPAKHKSCVAIGASDRNDKITEFSNRGPEVPCLAPGVDMLSTYKDGGYATLAGTSMACPIVAGVVALLMAARKARGDTVPRTAAAVRQMLAETADEGFPGDGFKVINPTKLVGPSAIPIPTPTPRIIELASKEEVTVRAK